MSYTTTYELPTEVRKSLDVNDQQVWMNIYNNSIGDGCDQSTQKEQAWMQCRALDSSRYVCANVSTQVVDKEGDMAIVQDYVKAGQQLVEDGGILTKNHSNKVIGTVWKVEEGIDGKTHLPCVVAYMNFFRGTMLYDQSWAEFKQGRTEFSIGSFTKKPERECDLKGCYYKLIPEQWFELSNVDRGINPITYPVEINDVAKGEEQPMEDEIPKGEIIDMHDDVCPAKAKYLRFKEQMKSWGHETHYDEEFLLIHGLLDEDEMAYIYQEYPDIREFEILRGEGDDEDYTLIMPKPINNDTDMLHEMVHLILDEQEAIQGYHDVLVSLSNCVYYSMEDIEKAQQILREIKHDEEKHIGSILEAIKVLDADVYSNIAQGMKESQEEATKGECPAGQHEHAGVWGCHDIFRKHHADDKTLPTDQLDLTNENIDVNAIQDTPTDRLKEIVRKVAKVLSHYGDKEVQTFLSSTPGKEFVLAFLELKRRKMNGESNMTEKEAGCSKAEELKAEESADTEPVQEAEKGTIPDIQSSIANISSTLASITAVIDQMNIRLMKLEDSDLMGEANAQGTSITDAIMSEAESEEESEIPPAVEIDGESEGKGEVPPQFEKTDDDAEDSSEDEDKAEDETETKVEIETKEEDESEDDDSKDDDESKDEDKSEDKEESKDEEKSEDKEESKEEDKKEESEEEKSEESESKEEEKKEDEKEKGCAKGEESEAVQTPEDAPAEAGVPTDAEEPVVEEAKQDVPAVDEPEARVVESIETSQPVEDDFEYPIPNGGQAVDFRAMLMGRQAELKAKGVELYIAEEGAQNSLANVPVEQIKGTNVSLVRPSNKIGAFDAEMGIKSHSSNDAWKKMGSTTDSTNFLKQLIGE